jgi:hypothetical protein
MRLSLGFAGLLWLFGAACDPGGGSATPTPAASATPTVGAGPTLGTFGGAATPPAGTEDLLKAHLAGRLGAAPGDIDLVSFEPTSWSDACLGVASPGGACAQTITPGWIATLRGPDGTEYRYHGAGGRFVPAP